MAQSVPVALRILHTNDMHCTLNEAISERLQQMRSTVDLYFDTGDAIQTGNLGIPIRPEPVWPLLEALHCTASVPGNRESHVMESALQAKLKGANHPILCANLRKRDGSYPFPKSLTIECQGIKIGLVGVMVPMVTERMMTQAVSAYLWDPPIPTALNEARALKPNVDLLIALTHIGYREDVALAETGMFQIIFGGHSHTVVQQPELHGKTWVCQGGSHNRYAGVYEWDGTLTGGLQPLKP